MDVLEAALQQVQDLLDAEQEGKALDRILAFKQDPQITRFTLIQALISTGQQRSDLKLTLCALEAFERIKAKAPYDSGLYYDIASAYLECVDSAVRIDRVSIFDCESEIDKAIKYFRKANLADSRVLTNFGNLYDLIGRPIEALDCYERALVSDSNFAMAAGNKAVTLENLAHTTINATTYFIHAHQLYRSALTSAASLIEVGGEEARDEFQRRDEAIVQRFMANGNRQALDADLAHGSYDARPLSSFIRKYIETCIHYDLYLNLHIVDKMADASIGDTFLPRLRTGSGETDRQQFVEDIVFRLNEIRESYMTARLLFVRSQFPSEDQNVVSEQTTVINNLDYSVSNIYVGLLKAAYKEAFSALDKVANLINHYLNLGHPEDKVYYGNVWYEPGPADRSAPSHVSEKVKTKGWRLFGLYLLCMELRGSKYSNLRNALTHRYVRVYRIFPGGKETYEFEDLSRMTGEILHMIKCAIMYASIFIDNNERTKYPAGSGPAGQLSLNTNQNLDLWQPGLMPGG